MMNSSKLRMTIKDLLLHFFSTLIFSSIIYFKSGNLLYGLIFILGGIFIDLDHLIDYFLFFKNRFNPADFFKLNFIKSGKVYVFFHSWEINFLLFIFGLGIKSSPLLILTLGMSVHLIIDNLQRKNLFFYFLIYRIIKKFDLKVLLPELYPFYR